MSHSLAVRGAAQELALGNLVFLEESGYRSFFMRLLKPFVHYVPFWRERPQARLAKTRGACEDCPKRRVVGLRDRRTVVASIAHRRFSTLWRGLKRTMTRRRSSRGGARSSLGGVRGRAPCSAKKRRGCLCGSADIRGTLRYLTPRGVNCYWDLLLRNLPSIMCAHHSQSTAACPRVD